MRALTQLSRHPPISGTTSTGCSKSNIREGGGGAAAGGGADERTTVDLADCERPGRIWHAGAAGCFGQDDGGWQVRDGRNISFILRV